MNFVGNYFDKTNSATLGLSLASHGLIFLALYFYGSLFHAPQYDINRGSVQLAIDLVEASTVASHESIRHIKTQAHPEVAVEKKAMAAQKDSAESAPAQAGAQTMAQPNYMQNPPPTYPRISRVRGEEGVVTLRVEVTPEGLVKDLNLAKSSGFDLLDDAAVTTVKRWSFRPAKIGGVAVASVVEIPIRFKLGSI